MYVPLSIACVVLCGVQACDSVWHARDSVWRVWDSVCGIRLYDCVYVCENETLCMNELVCEHLFVPDLTNPNPY